MRPLGQVDISFRPHAVLGYATSTQSRGTSVETDVSTTDISLLPSSVCSAGDKLKQVNQPHLKDYGSTLGEITLDSTHLTSGNDNGNDIETSGQGAKGEVQKD